MSKWYAYGEAPLTYWALRIRLDVILSQLRDASDPNATTVFYRPSFGRGGNDTIDTPRAEFGEFDAIIATSRHTAHNKYMHQHLHAPGFSIFFVNYSGVHEW